MKLKAVNIKKNIAGRIETGTTTNAALQWAALLNYEKTIIYSKNAYCCRGHRVKF